MNDLISQFAKSLISVSDATFKSPQASLPANLQATYLRFLSLCDGGYTGDHFVHLFGRQGPPAHNALERNRLELWKCNFGLDEESFVFAEDILGAQYLFDIRGNRRVVKVLDPDSGEMSLAANTFEDFLAEHVLGQSLNAHLRLIAKRFFEVSQQQFQPFTHISYKIPLSLGGDTEDLENMELLPAITNLRILGQIRKQIADLPSGTRIRNVHINHETQEVTLEPEL